MRLESYTLPFTSPIFCISLTHLLFVTAILSLDSSLNSPSNSLQLHANMKPMAHLTLEERDHDAPDGAKSYVSAKYLGTEGDKAQMRMLGRTQETRRVFTFITILGFGSTLIVTWEVLLTNIGLILINGGTAGMFWGFLFVFVGWILVYLSLSEMASMAPTSGGQVSLLFRFDRHKLELT